MQTEIKINYDLSRFEKLLELEDRQHIDPIFEAWGTIYRAAMQERFSKFARGGGDWEPLAPSTIKRRRRPKRGRKKKQRTASILMNTGTLWGTLSPQFNVDGQYQVIDKNSVSIGIEGGEHPSGMTIGKLAAIHHYGTEHIPARSILVEPDEATQDQMARAMEIGLQKGFDDRSA